MYLIQKAKQHQNMEESDSLEASAMSHLIEALEKANVKITFGLQPHHIEKIEAELKRWEEMPPLSEGDKCGAKYIKYVWEKLGVELGWCPFTLCLYYFEHLEGLRNAEAKN